MGIRKGERHEEKGQWCVIMRVSQESQEDCEALVLVLFFKIISFSL